MGGEKECNKRRVQQKKNATKEECNKKKECNKRTGKLLTRAAFGRFGQHIKEKFDDYCSWPDC